MRYSIGDRVSWRSLNRDYTGEITGYHGPFAIARIDGSTKSVLLQNETLNPKCREKDAAR